MSGIVGGKNHRGSGLIANLGSDGEVLTSAGAGLRQVFEAAGGGGAWTFISSATASSSTTVEFVDGTGGTVIDNTYDMYMLTIDNLVSSSATLRPALQVAVGGTFQAGGSDYVYNAYGRMTCGGNIDAGSNGSYGMHLQGDTVMWSAVAKSGDGIIYFHNPASTTHYKKFQWFWSAWGAYDDCFINGYGTGVYDTATSAINGVRLLARVSGNFTSGTFRLYGLAKS